MHYPKSPSESRATLLRGYSGWDPRFRKRLNRDGIAAGCSSKLNEDGQTRAKPAQGRERGRERGNSYTSSNCTQIADTCKAARFDEYVIYSTHVLLLYAVRAAMCALLKYESRVEYTRRRRKYHTAVTLRLLLA